MSVITLHFLRLFIVLLPSEKKNLGKNHLELISKIVPCDDMVLHSYILG